MESWFLSKYKPWLCGFFICIMMLPIFMVGQIQGACIEEERKALLEIKASLNDFCYTYHVCNNLLPTWVDHGNTGGKCCDWERVKCNTTTGHVTDLSLGNMNDDDLDYYFYSDRIWPLNASLFLHFKELRSLDLSFNHIDDTILSTGLERLSSLKKLETFNLSDNSVGSGLFPSLGAVTSLKILDISFTAKGYDPVSREAGNQNDISILAALENLVVLDLTYSDSYGTFQMQGGSEKVSRLKSLETLYLGGNQFNETLIMSLSAIPSLKEVDLSDIQLSAAEGCKSLSRLKRLENITLANTNIDKSVISCLSFLPFLKNLDLSDSNSTNLGSSFPMQGCKSLSRLKRLETLSLRSTHLDEGVISCLSFLPSLKSLDLSGSISTNSGSSFPMQEFRELEALDLSYCELRSLTTNGTINNKLVRLMLDSNSFNADVMRSIAAFPSLRILSMNSYIFDAVNSIGLQKPLELPNLPDLEILSLRYSNFNGTLPKEALASSHHLEVLDLSDNEFFGSIPSTIRSLSSLRVISLAGNAFNGSLTESGLCDLKNLHELDLSYNMFSGSLPECFNRLSSLKLFDLSYNMFSGTLPPSLIANLTSLEYVDFSHNKFEGSISFSLFSNHTKLELVGFVSENDKFVVITEEPKGWIPTFQLKVLVLSNCNVNRPKGSGVPSFLLLQHELQVLDMLLEHFILVKNVVFNFS